jgi:glutaredoxin-related protein
MKKISFIYLPLLFLIYVSTEAILKLFHSSLCESTGCKLADNLLRFDSIYLNFVGVFDALIILILGWLSFNKKISEKAFFLVLIASLLFETIMLGYQYYVSPQMCKFCIGVYAFLVIITILSTKKYFFIVVPAIISVFIALSFLALPKSKAFVVKNGNYLIQSPLCPHCKKVKEYLKKENIKFKKLDISDIESKNFATFLDFKTIPILIVKNNKDVKIINGDKNIIEYFKSKKTTVIQNIETPVQEESSSSTSLLYEDDKEANEGCGFISLDKLESDCTKK